MDFVVQQAGEIIPVEVKFSDLKKRNMSRSLHSFINHYKPSKAMVINLGLDEQFKLNDTTIEFMPYWKLMPG